MKRKIMSKLLDWKRNSNGKTAALITGARRVGKSYIAEEFAKKEYKASLVVNFTLFPRKVQARFYRLFVKNDKFMHTAEASRLFYANEGELNKLLIFS